MARTLSLLVVAVLSLAGTSAAEPPPAKGEFLVATEQADGSIFEHTVILLLEYDDTGAAGLVVNRPTDVKATELFSADSPMRDYDGAIYWGGPVRMASLRALSNTGRPPEGAERIVDSVYVVPFKEDMTKVSKLRLFIGFAGWQPGQLDMELARGSWHVVPATGDDVFAEDPAGLWKQLLPVETIRASLHRPRIGRVIQPADDPAVVRLVAGR
jgi:putative transcriptional regulator